MTDQLDRLTAALADRYAIERELGAGGMATVYLAEDLKLHRKVAVKVLRPELAAALGPDRVLREIDIAAQLNHPHILGVHDCGEADDFLYYVMPHIDGESLRDRIAREGELPIADTVKILREVVDALTAAHQNGIVHRDIKPDNVLLTGGHALVADFGVAKAVSEATGRNELTTAGIALGTPTYMSPEQAAADANIDHRSDIYSVGVLAYELLTGRPPFTDGSAQAVLASVIASAPDPVNAHRASVPAALADLVMRCLEKRPADRWQRTEELLHQLEVLGTPSGGVTPASAHTMAGPPSRGRWIGLSLTGAVVVAAVGYGSWTGGRQGPMIEVSNLRQITRAQGLEFDPAISPDGGEIVYSAGRQGDVSLYVRDLQGGRPIALTEDRPGEQIQARWAPDGSSIVFWDLATGVRVLRIPRFGGPTQPVERPFVHGEATLSFRVDSLFINRTPEGPAEFLTPAPTDMRSLVWSPDGQLIAYVTGNLFYRQTGNLGNVSPSTLWVLKLDGTAPIQITESSSLNASPAWLPDSRRLMFVSDREGARDLYVVRLDGSGRARGDPERLTTGLNPHTVSVTDDGSVAAYSQLIYRSNIWAIDLPSSGTVLLSNARRVTSGNQIIEAHDASPDGEWLAYDSNLDGTQDIYLTRLDEPDARRVTTHPGYDFHPSFSPDGLEVVFHSTRHGSRDLFIIGADGSNETRLTDAPGGEMNPEFSPDGLRILFRDSENGTFVMEREAIGQPWREPYQVHASNGNAVWSPDGDYVLVTDFRRPPGQRPSSRLVAVSLDRQIRVIVNAEEFGLGPITTPMSSTDGASIYFGSSNAGRRGFYVVPVEGGTPRLVVEYDDSSRQVQFTPTISGNTLFLTVTEHESDIYVMDLTIR